MRIAFAQAVAATEGRPLGSAFPATFGVATDTRTLAPGDAFVALRGARYDGHDFLAAALAKGAACLVVSDAGRVPAGACALVVADTTRAYLALGGLARRHSRATIAALTGSTGKTTTKAFLARLLESVTPGRVAATVANENNEIGVAKSLLALEPGSAYGVVEFGARHYGEIVPLALAAQPDLAVLTNVGDAHLEIMGSRERLAETKWGIFITGAPAVLSVADEVSRARAHTLEAPIAWAALEEEGDDVALRAGDVLVRLLGRERLEICRGTADENRVTRLGRDGFPTKVSVSGNHNRRNAVAAAAAAIRLGAAPAVVAAALETLDLPAGRYERVAFEGFEAVYDAYNASMTGTLATLASFATEPAGRRIAVLGSMAELGIEAPEMHARVGAAAAASNLDALLVGGEHAGDLARGARGAGFPAAAIVPFADNDEAVAWLRAQVRPGDLVLLKGSRRYRLEEILERLRSAHAG